MANSALRIDAGRRKVENVALDVWKQTASQKDVIVDFGTKPAPEKILQVIRLVVSDDKEIEVVIRDVAVREYIKHAATGAAVGAGIGAASFLTAAVKGVSFTFPQVLAILGVSALLGGFVGGATATVSRVTVFRKNGSTRVLFSAIQAEVS